jgi:hypothetical protein
VILKEIVIFCMFLNKYRKMFDVTHILTSGKSQAGQYLSKRKFEFFLVKVHLKSGFR